MKLINQSGLVSLLAFAFRKLWMCFRVRQNFRSIEIFSNIRKIDERWRRTPSPHYEDVTTKHAVSCRDVTISRELFHSQKSALFPRNDMSSSLGRDALGRFLLLWVLAKPNKTSPVGLLSLSPIARYGWMPSCNRIGHSSTTTRQAREAALVIMTLLLEAISILEPTETVPGVSINSMTKSDV